MSEHRHSKRHSRTSRKRDAGVGVQRGRLVDGMDGEERSQLMIVLAATGLILVLAQLFGMIWFGSHPNAMNETLIPAAYHLLVLAILFFGGMILAVSLAFNRKNYVAWRTWGVIVLWGLTLASYAWWYKIIPYLYG